jgi:hypothetical protein
MSTMTDDRDDGAEPPMPLRNAELGSLLRCTRCKLSYLPQKSTSALKLTYCSFLCELGDLGFSMTGLEHMELRKPEPGETPEPEAVAAG